MIYVFDGYELDLECYELRLHGEPLHIEPQVFELLAYLVQHHGQFVSKEDLYTHLWPQQFVSESALAYCITAARKAVGDDGRVQRLIKTVYRRGYRFIAPVQEGLGSGADVLTSSGCDSLAEEQFSDPIRMELPALPIQAEQQVSLSPEEVTGDRPLFPMVSALEAERRQLTVMWCRVVASSVLSEPLDPEELYEVMQDVHNVCTEVIQRFEGYTAQRSGDGLLVYFGYPSAHEDDACRAVRTALEIVQVFGRLGVGLERESGIKLAVRAGIHTGMVVVSEGSSADKREHLMLGNTPHIAVQLASLAAPSTVLISPATLHLVQGYVVWQALGSYMLEELSQPLAVYQVLQESGAESRFAAAITLGLTPFVGRREEVGLLRERWEQARRGMGQVVLLSGEAGIGKSRLVQVLQERMAEGRYARIECRCSPYHQNSTLYPVVTYVQQGLLWHQDDTSQGKLGKLEAALAPYGFVLEETIPLLTSLFSLPLPAAYPPLNLPPQRQKQKTFEVLLALLLKQAETQPLCFVMEDLHWADPSTLELLGLLMNQIQTIPMLLLLTFRPDFRPPWAMRSHVTYIALNRLSRRQVEQMSMRITRGQALPAAVLQQLVVKSDGVPLFVEEMTRMVLESGLIKEHDGQYELVGPLTALAIPSTLHDLLMARLDRLGTDKQVAQLGAALGREFPYELIQAVSQMAEAALQRSLAYLVDAELLYQQGFPPHTRYTFRHVLIQEAAYQSLLRRTRQRYHRQIAQVLETRFPETCNTQPELLAYHYMEAGLHAQALGYWQRAAQEAMNRTAYLDALAHAQQGLAVVASLADAPEHYRSELILQTILGAALTQTRGGNGTPEVIQAYERVRVLCEQVDDMPLLFTVLRSLWMFYLLRGELTVAYKLGERLLSLVQRSNNPALAPEAHRTVATSLFFLGEQTAVAPHLERCLRFDNAQQPGTLRLHYGQDTRIMVLLYTALNLWLRGYPDQALEAMNQMMCLTEQCPPSYSRAHALTLAAVLHQWRRETHIVRTRVEASIALTDEYRSPFLQALVATFQGWVLAQQGRHEEGIAQMRRGITAYRATGTELFSTHMLALLAEAYQQDGAIAAGLHTLTEALALLTTHGERSWEAELYRLQGELLLQCSISQVAQAEAALKQALTVARHQHAKSLELRATMSLCRLWQQQGKHRQAHNLLRKIYSWFTEGQDTADLKEARVLLETLSS